LMLGVFLKKMFVAFVGWLFLINIAFVVVVVCLGCCLFL
jgi:hypothetical protein